MLLNIFFKLNLVFTLRTLLCNNSIGLDNGIVEKEEYEKRMKAVVRYADGNILLVRDLIGDIVVAAAVGSAAVETAVHIVEFAAAAVGLNHSNKHPRKSPLDFALHGHLSLHQPIPPL